MLNKMKKVAGTVRLLSRGVGVLKGREVFAQSITRPVEFWNNAAKDVVWSKWVEHGGAGKLEGKLEDPADSWFPDSTLNFSENCLDVHVAAGRGDQLALIFDSPVTGTVNKVTYSELLSKVEMCSHILSSKMGVCKGDRVILYMPNSIEAIVVMLSCARIGAIHSVVFGGFAPHELAVRIRDCRPSAIVFSSCGIDGKKVIPYAPLVVKALELSGDKTVKPSILLFQRDQHMASPKDVTAAVSHVGDGRVFDWDTEVKSIQKDRKLTSPLPVLSSHPLFILYTSGTTGAPKGVVRETGGYAVGLKWSMRNVFGLKAGDVFWGASDVGWIVGHLSFYGSLLVGATSIVYEGKPVGTPDESNFWRVIERHKVNSLFTAPTALRAIKKLDDRGEQARNFNLSSLKQIFCAGEHLDPDTLRWAQRATEKPILDNWWQTESGAPMCGPLVGIDGLSKLEVKPGSAFHAVPGYNLKILDHDGKEREAGQMGLLVCKLPAPPGFMTGLYNNRKRFESSYLKKFPGYYDTGDAGMIDHSGYVWIMSRVDDVINVAGHRFSTGQMEECISEIEEVAEVAVVGIKDQLKGQLPLGLCVLNASALRNGVTEDSVALKAQAIIREKIGAVACFGAKSLCVVEALPKTRSGKVLRGTLRNIANHEEYIIPATIEDPAVLESIAAVIRRHEKI